MTARGKFLHLGAEKLYVKGVTYGTFAARECGSSFPEPGRVVRDFEAMAAAGINAIRTYTAPATWLLDEALHHGLLVLVGLPWEQHVAFLEDRARRAAIRRGVRERVRGLAGHPAVLGYAVGNEIPAPVVRWHGRQRVEAFLESLFDDAKAEDPAGLVTYVNFPTTEYLKLPFLDFLSFNVYLESRERLEAYLARLQNAAGDRPLVMAELGLDSLRNGHETQARVLDWQIRSTFGAGCAGMFVFAWTDEWHRGGHEVEDWDFGLTTRERAPKPALTSVEEAYADVPVPGLPRWPRISVVVCTHNGARTLEETLRCLGRLDYPDYEVLVVNDGSTDDTRALIARHDVRSIETANRGLSSARNTGWREAAGEIIAYIDDDAYPDPQWLRYVARVLVEEDVAAVGGPNVPPVDDPLVAQSVARAPGGPTHVLLSDREAEHIPGCNMAFRRRVLEELGGFDPRFRSAGDDVDLCWRILDVGGKIGFHPGAMVWHHRRGSIRTYWKQQVGYGKAEALLENKWPDRYNSLGHVAWNGRVYGDGLTRALLRGAGRVYQGTFGTAPFQSLYERRPGTLLSLPLMPEWYLLIAVLLGLVALAPLWSPLVFALPVLVAVVGVAVIQAVATSLTVRPPSGYVGTVERLRFRSLTALLHLIQPAARLWGRVKHGLTPWRRRGLKGWIFPRRRSLAIWTERWKSRGGWLGWLGKRLRKAKVATVAGGAFDPWDLDVRGGLFGGARLVMVNEEHGEGKQYLRFRIWPRLRHGFFLLTLPGLVLAALALLNGAVVAGMVLGGGAMGLGLLTLSECGSAEAAVLRMLGRLEYRAGIRAKSGGRATGPAEVTSREDP